ncbi:MAG: VanZ family protein [Pseudomonadota bacterium]
MMKWAVQPAWFLSIILVSYLSLTSSIEMPYEFSGADKLGHFLAYTWLAALPFLGFARTRAAFTGAFLMVPLGIGLEFAQLHVPGRNFSVADMIADCAGVALVIFVANHIKKKAVSKDGLIA